MAKYHGKIGFVTTKETAPGVHEEIPIEREYFGDVIRNSKRWEAGSDINDDIQINNQISIVADDYLNDNFFAIRYVSWMRCLWKVISVEMQRHRITLTIGGIYNGPAARFTEETCRDHGV